jgi:hypothetical protein
MRSTDPDFETKAADVIGLYFDPPNHAVVSCVDEKTAIQALDQIDPILPLSPARAERHGFEYYRHGTLSLYAALNTRTGEVLGTAVPRHTSEEFVTFLESVVDTQPRRRAIHIIVDDLSAHKTEKVQNVPRRASDGAVALHAHVFLVAESNRTVVLEARARRHCARRLHVGSRSPSQTDAIHQAVQQGAEAASLVLLRPGEADRMITVQIVRTGH